MSRAFPFNPQSYPRHRAAKLSYGKRFERRADMGNRVPRNIPRYSARHDKSLKRVAALQTPTDPEPDPIDALAAAWQAAAEAQLALEADLFDPVHDFLISWWTDHPDQRPTRHHTAKFRVEPPAYEASFFLAMRDELEDRLLAKTTLVAELPNLAAPQAEARSLPIDQAARLCGVDLDEPQPIRMPTPIASLVTSAPAPPLSDLPCARCKRVSERHFVLPLRAGGGFLCQPCACELGICARARCKPRIPIPAPQPEPEGLGDAVPIGVMPRPEYGWYPVRDFAELRGACKAFEIRYGRKPGLIKLPADPKKPSEKSCSG